MPDLDEINPHPEDEPRLRWAWEDGYRAAEQGRESPDSLDDPDPVARVWLEGYQAATQHRTDRDFQATRKKED